MNKFLVFTFLLLFFNSFSSFSQKRKLSRSGINTPKSGGNSGNLNDSISSGEIDVTLSGKTKYTDYKIISHKRDTTIIDTTLTLQKEYKFNFLRKDNFELLPFHNQGQTFNSLGYNFSNNSLFPDIGFSAKQFNFYQIEDINYYHLPTPTTQIMYRTGMEQGQVLDALFTLNFSKRLNVALEYKGLRSLGQYRSSLASHGNFRASFTYETKKGQYSIKGHTAIQDIFNEESGGLTDDSLTAFITNDENSANDRGRLDVNLTDTENYFDGKRYYLEHSFRLFSTENSKETKEKTNAKTEIPKDSLFIDKIDSIAKNKAITKINTTSKTDSIANKTLPKENTNFTNLKVGHVVLLDNKFYKFEQPTLNTTMFGSANITGNISTITDYQFLSNQLFLDFNSKYILGNFRAKVTHSTYEYGYNELTNINAYPNVNVDKLSGDAISFGADWNGKIDKFKVNASAQITPGNGRLAGNDFKAEAIYKKDSLFTIKGRLNINSKSPNFNTLLHQSNYDNYNWQNNFENIGTRNIGGTFESKWGNASLDITNIDGYVYFNENGTPQQASENINYLKAKVSKEFKVGKFALDNTIMYQNVSNGSSVFRVPELVSRNTLYYADSWFKGKPILVNIGVTFKYFSKYKANAYNPLLAEFQLQNDTEIGYPTFDVFFNARVRRTRIYLKLDNVTSSFAEKNYFSAPSYPYRDFSIRFGLVWNWFI